MNRLNGLLFCHANLNDFLQNNLRRAVQIVDEIPEQQFIGSDDGDMESHVHSRTEVLPIELREEEKVMDPQETQVDVSYDQNRINYSRKGPIQIPGILITVSIPFTGDPKLWDCRPNIGNLNPPRAKIRCQSIEEYQGFLDIAIEKPLHMVINKSELKDEIDDILSNINWFLQQVNKQVNDHNDELKEKIRQSISDRRQRLGKCAEIADAMNIPLKRKEGSPDVTKLPIKRRLIKPLQTKNNTPPEPAISEEDYEYILNVIRYEGSTYETTPKTYKVHDEEELRDIMLAHLNGHYKGSATGETFRKSGKTDIRIENNQRAAFVGECKIWRGEKELLNTVDQLLGYLTWRDCKAAIIIFNKDVAGFSAIQKKIPEILKEHKNYLQMAKIDQMGEWRLRAKSADDPERLITIHVFLFNIYTNPNSSKENA